MSVNVWPSNREPYHGDIVQGHLGNCFLIASLQALTSCQPQLLKSIISSLSPLTCSFYRQGTRTEVPVVLEPITEEYQYCRSTVENVQWPYIIEQTYAKFYGGRFENLIGGNTSEALYDLLGKPVQEFEPNDQDLWDKIERGLAEKTILVTCGAIVTNGIVTHTNTPSGLLINHAYAILATFIYKQTREKYVVIHNPQGTNHLLKENNSVQNAFFSTIAKTHPLWLNTVGTQLVSWSELKQSCNRIQICYLNVESRQTLTNEWSSMTSGGCSNFPTFYRNPYIVVSPSHLKSLVVVLGHTTDQRHERKATDVKLSYPQLGITIVQLKSHLIPTHDNYEIIYQTKFWNKREVTYAIDFEPKQGQQYAVVLSTYFPNNNTSFWLQLFSKQTLPTLELRTWTSTFQQNVQTIDGEWHQSNSGGRRNKSSPLAFYQNPAYLLTVSEITSVQFILHQSFSTVVPLAQYHPMAIYVLSTTINEEPSFTRARSVSRLVRLNPGEEYYVIPTCYDAKSFGKFQLDVLSNVPLTLDPVERKLTPPSPPPAENKSTTNGTAARTKTVPKKGNLSLAQARLSSLADEYSKKDIIE